MRSDEREILRQRFQFRCGYCGVRETDAGAELTADHFQPRSRGGSWRHHIKVSRCAARSSIPPEFKYADYGFRVARDI